MSETSHLGPEHRTALDQLGRGLVGALLSAAERVDAEGDVELTDDEPRADQQARTV